MLLLITILSIFLIKHITTKKNLFFYGKIITLISFSFHTITHKNIHFTLLSSSLSLLKMNMNIKKYNQELSNTSSVSTLKSLNSHNLKNAKQQHFRRRIPDKSMACTNQCLGTCRNFFFQKKEVTFCDEPKQGFGQH